MTKLEIERFKLLAEGEYPELVAYIRWLETEVKILEDRLDEYDK